MVTSTVHNGFELCLPKDGPRCESFQQESQVPQHVVAWVLEWKLRILAGYQVYHRGGSIFLIRTYCYCHVSVIHYHGKAKVILRQKGAGMHQETNACSKQASLYSRHGRIGRGKECRHIFGCQGSCARAYVPKHGWVEEKSRLFFLALEKDNADSAERAWPATPALLPRRQ